MNQILRSLYGLDLSWEDELDEDSDQDEHSSPTSPPTSPPLPTPYYCVVELEQLSLSQAGLALHKPFEAVQRKRAVHAHVNGDDKVNKGDIDGLGARADKVNKGDIDGLGARADEINKGDIDDHQQVGWGQGFGFFLGFRVDASLGHHGAVP